MSRHTTRPPFGFPAKFQAAKAFTLNGTPYQAGQHLEDADYSVGERRLRQLYDFRFIDFATDSVPGHYPQGKGYSSSAKPTSLEPEKKGKKGKKAGQEAERHVSGGEGSGEPVTPPGGAPVAPEAQEGGSGGGEDEGSKQDEGGADVITKPVTMEHKGFGRFYFTDAKGRDLGNVAGKEAAEARLAELNG